MPKLTSKLTIKFEPKLLKALQERADAEGLPVSSYVRKAVIRYIGEDRAANAPHILRIEMTPQEARVINEMTRLGMIRRSEDMFHTAFDHFLWNGEYQRRSDHIKDRYLYDPYSDMRGSPRSRSSGSKPIDFDLEEEDPEEES